MNALLHRSADRGHVSMGWLKSKHSFSFGNWHNPKYMGVSALRVINDDEIAAHRGFGTHPHNNMEILTCVLKGAISHKDSMGNEGDIKAGEWQLMSAGTGVAHSEMNQGDEDVHLLQIWVIPNVQNPAPTYQQIAFEAKDFPNQWHLIAAPEGTENAKMVIRQDTEISTAVLEEGKTLPIVTTRKVHYVHVIEGEVQIGEHTAKAGDALIFNDSAEMTALQDARVIWFNLP